MDSPRPNQRYLQRRRQSLPAVLHTPEPTDREDEDDKDERATGRKQVRPIAEEETIVQLSKDIKDLLKKYRTTGSTASKRPWFLNQHNASTVGSSESPRPTTSFNRNRRGSADMLTLTARMKAIRENSKAPVSRSGSFNSTKNGIDNKVDTGHGDDSPRLRANSWSPVLPAQTKNGEKKTPAADCEDSVSPPPATYLRRERRHSVDVVSNAPTPRGILKTPRSERHEPTIWDTTFDEAAGFGMPGTKPAMFGNININGDVSDNLPNGSDAFRQALGCLAKHNQHRENNDYSETQVSTSDSGEVNLFTKLHESIPERGQGGTQEDVVSESEDCAPVPSQKKHVHFGDVKTTYP